MIRYATLMIALLCSCIVTAQNEGIGYLHSVKLEVDESIRSSSEYVKNFDGYTGNKGSYSKEIYEALKNLDAEVALTLYPEAGHDSWNNVFKEPGLMSWVFKHSR